MHDFAYLIQYTYMRKIKCLDCDHQFEIEADTQEGAMKEMMPHYMEAHKEMMAGQNEESKKEWMTRFHEAWVHADDIRI